MGTQLTGLASGLDWGSLVDQLMQANAIPQTNVKAQQTKVNQQATALGDLKNLVSALQTSQKALQAEGALTARTVTSSETTGAWGSTAAAGATPGTYKIQVTHLAKATTLAGVARPSEGLSSSSDVSGTLISSMRLGQPITAGTFSINGAQVNVATTDSLQDVFDRINTATNGAVTASYDATTDQISLSGSGPIMLGSGADTSNFLGATKLYNNGTGSVTSSSALSTVKLNVPIAQAGLKQPITAVDADGNGTFNANGVAIAYNVNTDTIQDVMNRINNSAGGVTASYSSGQNQFQLANTKAGNTGLFTTEDAGGLLSALGLGSGAALTQGENAEFTVNGGPTQVATSNTLDSTALGITGLSVTPTTLGTQTLTVAPDTTSVKTKLDDFVTKFNAVESFIADKTKVSVSGTKVTTGLLYGNTEVTELGRSLRSMIFQATAGASGKLTRLADLGLDFSGTTNTLSIKDSTALTSALANPQVAELFSSNANSSMSKLGGLITKTIGTNGSIPNNVSRLNQRSRDYDTQIARMQRQLDAQKAALNASFQAMESAQGNLKQQQSSLNNALGLTTS